MTVQGRIAAGLAALMMMLAMAGCSSSTTRAAVQDDQVGGSFLYKDITLIISNQSDWPVDVTAKWMNLINTTHKSAHLKPKQFVVYTNVVDPALPVTLLSMDATPDKPTSDWSVFMAFFNSINKPTFYRGTLTQAGTPHSWQDTFPVGGKRTIVEEGVGMTIERKPDTSNDKVYQVTFFTPAPGGAST